MLPQTASIQRNCENVMNTRTAVEETGTGTRHSRKLMRLLCGRWLAKDCVHMLGAYTNSPSSGL